MTSSCLGQISHIPNNSMPCTLTFFDNQENQRAKDRDQPHQRLIQPQDEMKRHLEMEEGSSDHQQLISPNSINNCCNEYFTNHSLPFHNGREGIEQHESVKWMPSKMRIMRKLMNSDHHTTRKPRKRQNQPQEHKQSSQERSNENFHQGTVRVCSACKTTKTPLWRSGPCGPKSLCNACGIRQRKERRAMAAGAVNGGQLGEAAGKSAKGMAANVDCRVPFKKRCRFTTAERKLCIEDRVFPQDEKDAAILLMTLSCGLICN